MTSSARPWFRECLVKAGVGWLLAVSVSVLLVVGGHVLFPEFAEFDRDFGLRAERYVDEYLVRHNTMLAPVAASATSDRYVLLDVDPQPGPQSARNTQQLQACVALQKSRTSRALLAGEVLDCPLGQPISRRLLAAVVRELTSHRARMIVVDILLDSTEAPDEKDEADLRAAIREAESAGILVLYARPATYVGVHGGTGAHQVLPDGDLPKVGGFGAVALPVPGHPVRRYPKCYLAEAGSGSGQPSLPWAAYRLLQDPQLTAASLCPTPSGSGDGGGLEDYGAPSIRYSLHGGGAYADGLPGARSLQRQLAQKFVYNRCAAAALWGGDSECASPETYRGRLVVVGATSSRRGDHHYTPIGTMSGADVVANAIRSFDLYERPDPSLGALLAKKLLVVSVCALPWLAFFCVSDRIRQRRSDGAYLGGRVLGETLQATLLVATVIVLLAITVATSMQSLTMLLGVIALGSDLYLDFAIALEVRATKVLRWMVGLPSQEH